MFTCRRQTRVSGTQTRWLDAPEAKSHRSAWKRRITSSSACLRAASPRSERPSCPDIEAGRADIKHSARNSVNNGSIQRGHEAYRCLHRRADQRWALVPKTRAREERAPCRPFKRTVPVILFTADKVRSNRRKCSVAIHGTFPDAPKMSTIWGMPIS